MAAVMVKWVQIVLVGSCSLLYSTSFSSYGASRTYCLLSDGRRRCGWQHWLLKRSATKIGAKVRFKTWILMFKQKLAMFRSLEFTCKTCQCSVRNVLPENDNDAAINKEDTTLDAEMTTPNDASPLEIETLIVTPPELSAASTSERATLPIASSTLQTPFYVYGICIAACFIAFLALLVRRLNL